ncbi:MULTISPECIES: IS3 family transposase [Gardnerella]|uniref:IS3 family transposase n=1 Tax=Gardnerella TaxID=2701 RepID=UPI0038996B22
MQITFSLHNFFAICYLSRSSWDSTEELRQAIHTYIDFYNNHRIKMGLKRQLWNIVLWLHKMSKNCPKPLLFSMSSNAEC